MISWTNWSKLLDLVPPSPSASPWHCPSEPGHVFYTSTFEMSSRWGKQSPTQDDWYVKQHDLSTRCSSPTRDHTPPPIHSWMRLWLGRERGLAVGEGLPGRLALAETRRPEMTDHWRQQGDQLGRLIDPHVGVVRQEDWQRMEMKHAQQNGKMPENLSLDEDVRLTPEWDSNSWAACTIVSSLRGDGYTIPLAVSILGHHLRKNESRLC